MSVVKELFLPPEGEFLYVIIHRGKKVETWYLLIISINSISIMMLLTKKYFIMKHVAEPL